MGIRFRILGAVIVACGLALCHGAFQLWPPVVPDSTLASLTIGALRVAGSGIAAVVGVLNVFAGIVVFLRPARN